MQRREREWMWRGENGKYEKKSRKKREYKPVKPLLLLIVCSSIRATRRRGRMYAVFSLLANRKYDWEINLFQQKNKAKKKEKQMEWKDADRLREIEKKPTEREKGNDRCHRRLSLHKIKWEKLQLVRYYLFRLDKHTRNYHCYASHVWTSSNMHRKDSPSSYTNLLAHTPPHCDVVYLCLTVGEKCLCAAFSPLLLLEHRLIIDHHQLYRHIFWFSMPASLPF